MYTLPNNNNNNINNNVSVADSSSGSPPTPMLPASVGPSSNHSDGYLSYDDESGYNGYIPSRKQREFIPENKKDDGYWEKRRKNNEAARRSREKRRVHDMALENRIMDLTRDNCKLRNELGLIKKKYGIPMEETFANENNETPITSLNNNSQTISTTHTQPPSMHTEFQTTRYSNGMPKSASPRNRSMSVSGPIQSSYLTSYQSPPHPSQHQPFMSPDPYYTSRESIDSDLKSYSGKFDAQSPFNLKSMKDDNHHYHPSRIDDQVRPSYSATLPPNQISAYRNALPVSSQKSYWIPTTDLTSSDSNDESEYYDRVQDQPLSLVKKRPSTENESCEEHSNSSRASNSPPTNSCLPLKLRHKVSNDSSTPESPPSSLPVYSNGLAQLSDIAMLHSSRASLDEYPSQNSSDSFKIRPRSYTNPRSLFDVKYVERRKRNNEAARKCRENRKHLTKLREVKSDYLVNENGKLKDELTGLQDEMRELRDLLEKKRQTREANGEMDNTEDDMDSEMENTHDNTGSQDEDMYTKMDEGREQN